MIVASIYAPRYEKWPGCDYDALLMVVEASCRRVGLRHVVISDSPRPAPLETAIFDLPKDPKDLMILLLDGQRQFLAATPGPVFFLGADCVLTRDPRPFLQGDMTINIGPWTPTPLNTGAVWCADGPTCAPVWADALARNPVHWGDDLICLYAAIQASGLHVGRVRAEEHDWAPESVDDPAGMPTVAHFRGKRKSLMAPWAKRHLGIDPVERTA
ncbi:MAG: hypothetical protein AB7O45_00465 [Alphaproteobacteria bacterium]